MARQPHIPQQERQRIREEESYVALNVDDVSSLMSLASEI